MARNSGMQKVATERFVFQAQVNGIRRTRRFTGTLQEAKVAHAAFRAGRCSRRCGKNLRNRWKSQHQSQAVFPDERGGRQCGIECGGTRRGFPVDARERIATHVFAQLM